MDEYASNFKKTKNYRALWRQVMDQNNKDENPIDIEALATANKIVQTWIRKNNMLWFTTNIKSELIRAVGRAIHNASLTTQKSNDNP